MCGKKSQRLNKGIQKKIIECLVNLCLRRIVDLFVGCTDTPANITVLDTVMHDYLHCEMDSGRWREYVSKTISHKLFTTFIVDKRSGVSKLSKSQNVSLEVTFTLSLSAGIITHKHSKILWFLRRERLLNITHKTSLDLYTLCTNVAAPHPSVFTQKLWYMAKQRVVLFE